MSTTTRRMPAAAAGGGTDDDVEQAVRVARMIDAAQPVSVGLLLDLGVRIAGAALGVIAQDHGRGPALRVAEAAVADLLDAVAPPAGRIVQ